ncbi:MAG TPA: tripartite tricarboxylate transporter substrate-binding protein [Stellaceae bacterium]|nr:tripartite tricarboxylate transporter substrate-binding protein [Stellaceae bacterium]
MKRLLSKLSLIGVCGLLFGMASVPSRADDLAGFYSGKTVTVAIGYSAGGGYDLYARLLARYMGKYIPGNPTIVPQNMPGAGSLKVAKYLYEVAPKDGTVFGTFSRSMPLAPVEGMEGATFDSRKFTWLGSMAKDVTMCVTSDESGIKDWAAALKTDFTVGGEGQGSDPDVFANVIKNVYGAKAKLVTGYPGTSEMFLALERGELAGICGVSYSTVMGRWAEPLKQGQLHIIVQGGLEKHADLPNVPNMLDLAADAHQKTLMRLILAPQAMARPFAAPPDIPAERAKALRDAFAAALKDPDLIAEAQKQKIDVGLMSAAQLQNLLDELYQAPKEIDVEAAKISGL